MGRGRRKGGGVGRGREEGWGEGGRRVGERFMRNKEFLFNTNGSIDTSIHMYTQLCTHRYVHTDTHTNTYTPLLIHVC